MKKTEKLAQIAGGRAFLDPAALALMLPLMLVSSLLTVNKEGNLESLLGWLVANLISFAACALVVVFLIRVPFRNRDIKPIKIYLVFSVGALLGLIKGAVTALVAWRLGFFVDIEQHFLSRISQTTVIGLVSIPALAVLSDFRFRYQEEREKLVLQKVRLALKQNHQEARKNSEDEKVVLLTFIRQAKSLVQDGVSAEAAFLIRNIIENNLRPLSHRLWHLESSKIDDYSFSSLMRLGLSKYPFRTQPMVLVYPPISFLFLLPIYGPLMSLGTTSIATLAVLATYGVANLLRPSNKQVPVWVFVAVNALATAMVMILPTLIFNQDSTTWNAGIWLSTFILLFEIGFVSLFVSAMIANHNTNRIQLSTLEATDSVKSALENRELANFLHGNVQNRLLAVALMIESNNGEPVKIVGELERIENSLHFGLARQINEPHLSFAASLETLRKRWLGFVSLEFNLIGNQKFSNSLSETLLQLVNEAITNSVRHGLARNIQIQIIQTVLGCEVIATDDGIGPKQGTKGIGSDYFDSVADLGWTLEPGEFGGTVLRLGIKGATN